MTDRSKIRDQLFDLHRPLLEKATPEQKDELCLHAMLIQRLVASTGSHCYDMEYKQHWDELFDVSAAIFGIAEDES